MVINLAFVLSMNMWTGMFVNERCAMLLISYCAVVPIDRHIDERRICWLAEGARHVVGLELEKQRKISLFWMSNKLIGGVPSFVIDFVWSYTWIMEMNTKIFRSIILRKDLFAILGAKVESGLL